MIQGNYTVKARASLEDLLQDCVTRGWSQSVTGLQQVLDQLRIAQPFLLPEGGRLFEVDGPKWKWRPRQLRLPYPCIALEYVSRGMARLVIAEERETPGGRGFDVYLTLLGAELIRGAKAGWVPLIHALLVEEALEDDAEIRLRFFRITPELDRFIITEPAHDHAAQQSAAYAVGVLMQMLCALECKNVSLDTIDPIPALQKKRAQSGKQPLLSYKVLTINADRGASLRSESAGSGHISRRTHLRRGHIRRLESGPIWVNATVVRGGTAGLVVKDYSVRRDH